MFKNQYQGGPFVEVFSAQGKSPVAKWKIFGSPSAIWKEYDKEVKGFVFVLKGSSQINKMQLPRESRQTLGLIQQFLTLQIFVPLGQDFSTELLITDIGNIKRRLYLSTVHKELSVTPLHAKIPLFTMKREIWCNMCIDLVGFTSETFRGAVFQSLDGIIISANCKVRKIFTLKSKPRDTPEEDDMCGVTSVQCKSTDVIPQTCQLKTDVPQVTQVLNLTDIRETEIRFRKDQLAVQETELISSGSFCPTAAEMNGMGGRFSLRLTTSRGSQQIREIDAKPRQVISSREMAAVSSHRMSHQEKEEKLWKGKFTDNLEELKKKKNRYYMQSCNSGSLVNRGQGRIPSSKTQDVSHIAFGSKILGPPPSSNRRVSRRVSGEVTKMHGSKSNRSWQSSGEGMESVQDIERLELSFSPWNDSLHQGDKRIAHQTTQDICQNDSTVQTQKTSESGRADFQLASPQGPSAEKNSHWRLSLKNAAKRDITSDGWEFPESLTESTQLDSGEQLVAAADSACHNLTSPQSASAEHRSSETGNHQVNDKEIFMFSSRPRSAPYGKSPNMSPEGCVFPLDLKKDSNRVHGETQVEDDFQGTESSEEDDNNEFSQGAENFEINHSRQQTPDSAVFKAMPLKRMSQKNECWMNEGHSEHNPKETVLSKPQNPAVRKADSVSSQRSLKPPLSLSPTGSKSEFFTVIPNGTEKNGRSEGVSSQLKKSISKMSLKTSREDPCLTTQTCWQEDSHYSGTKLGPQKPEEYGWKNCQSNRLSSSELQMLASMKREQNEELQDTGLSHGLSASQIDNCTVSISTSSEDTATWNSCLPPPISQEHHYQKEMSPLSHSNPRDWLNMFSPPIIPGSQQLEECAKSSTNQNIPGEDDLNAEADEEVLTLLYDPCLNCYFDPNSGKYYELA